MDIVDQLRKGFGSAMGRTAQVKGYHQLCGMAAQEIDRLRAVIQAMRQGVEASSDEFDELRADIARHVATCAEQARETERLKALIARCTDTIDCLRDYVCEGGSIRMVGAVQSIDEADSLLSEIAALAAKGE